MLNNLNWLNKGQVFPPQDEADRLDRYADNKRIFDNRHHEVYSEQIRRIEKVIGSTAEVLSYPIILNFQKKISLKTADFLFIEPPTFSAGEDEKMQTTIDEIAKVSDILDIGYQGAIDCSRFGTAVYKIDKVNGKGKISISSPEFLFTIVSAEDIKVITHYVLAWIYDDENEFGQTKTYLCAFIHEKGKYTKRVFEINGQIIGEMTEEKKNVKTGLKDFAIIPIHNLQTSDSIYGIDDYMDVDSIVSEIEIRTAQISKILDVHANPTVSGSVNALAQDRATGEYYFDAGNFYSRSSNDDPPLEYITWEASLDANFKQIEKLLNYLSVISEMGAAIFDGDLKTGNLPSGSALKRLYINVLAKVARLRNQFDQGLKKAIAIASQIGYKGKLETENINIIWQDGLPNDPKERAEIIGMRTANMQTMSAKRVMVEFDGLTEDAAKDELDLIQEEQALATGMIIPPAGPNYDKEPEDTKNVQKPDDTNEADDIDESEDDEISADK